MKKKIVKKKKRKSGVTVYLKLKLNHFFNWNRAKIKSKIKYTENIRLKTNSKL